MRKLLPIAAFLAGFSPAFAQTLIDASTELPWTASGSGSVSDVLITGDSSSSGLSATVLDFDTVTNWSITNRAYIVSNTVSDISATFRATGFTGIDIVNDGTVEALGGGADSNDAIYLSTDKQTANINITNNGVIHAAVSHGIDLRGGNDVVIHNSENGVIRVDNLSFAMLIGGFSGTVLIRNDGVIESPKTAAVSIGASTEMATIINNGSITGGWIYTQNPNHVLHHYTLINNGVIVDALTNYAGIEFCSGSCTDLVETLDFANDGSMTFRGDVLLLPQLVGSASIINTGVLRGGSNGGGYRGINITAVAGARAISISNSGTIRGDSYGIFIATNDSATRTDIANTGTIAGDSGPAIRFGTGINTLTLGTGSILDGDVDGSAGSSDAVFLKGTGTEDSQFIGIETFNMQGFDWTLSGILEFANAMLESGILRLHTGALTAARLDVQPGAILDTSAGSYSITGNLYNAGTVRIGRSDGTPGNTLSITGNYTGNGGLVILNTTPGATDRLVVTGDTSGHSRLQITDTGGFGAGIFNGIQVVQVSGASNGVFSLASPVQAGVYQYALSQGNALNAGNWYLVRAADPSGQLVYRPALSGYVAGQRIDADLGFQQLSSLHQRGGDHRGLSSTLQSWARAWHSRSSEQGRYAFDHESYSSGLQVGQEVFVSANSRVAISLDYARTGADFSDRHRGLAGLGRKTGSLEAQSLALGGYFTYAFQGGSYFDLAGQVATLRNRFRDIYGDQGTQTGWRGGLSVETGLPIGALSGWTFEPQFQLAYHTAQYRDFDDGISRIESYTAKALRARFGVRVFRDFASAPERKLHVYGTAHLVGDLLDPGSVKIGDMEISERYGKSWGEVGVGVQGGLSKSTSIFGELRVQQGFAGKDGKRSGGSLNVGLRYSF